ncbi:MAG: RluA family pseudouridine synthase [Ghiorsea sp.]
MLNPLSIQTPDIEQTIIFEDSRFIALNKPAGMAVHGVVEGRLGVIEALRRARPKAPYLELAHRLDKATSGCLLIAKRKSALRAFQNLQEHRGVDKHYVALVKGGWQGAHKKVDTPLLKMTDKTGAWSVVVDKDKGKRAVSYFEPLKRFENNTLVQIKIITGRTHQIRVHAAYIGFPIAGDDKYGDVVFNQMMKEKGLNRLYLHAQSLAFRLPDLPAYAFEAELAPLIS